VSSATQPGHNAVAHVLAALSYSIPDKFIAGPLASNARAPFIAVTGRGCRFVVNTRPNPARAWVQYVKCLSVRGLVRQVEIRWNWFPSPIEDGLNANALGHGERHGNTGNNVDLRAALTTFRFGAALPDREAAAVEAGTRQAKNVALPLGSPQAQHVGGAHPVRHGAGDEFLVGCERPRFIALRKSPTALRSALTALPAPVRVCFT
jgi:hypothetical protein